jgi:hypothetical protein
MLPHPEQAVETLAKQFTLDLVGSGRNSFSGNLFRIPNRPHFDSTPDVVTESAAMATQEDFSLIFIRSDHFRSGCALKFPFASE